MCVCVCVCVCVPLSGSRRPVNILIVVDLPAPLCPTHLYTRDIIYIDVTIRSLFVLGI